MTIIQEPSTTIKEQTLNHSEIFPYEEVPLGQLDFSWIKALDNPRIHEYLARYFDQVAVNLSKGIYEKDLLPNSLGPHPLRNWQRDIEPVFLNLRISPLENYLVIRPTDDGKKLVICGNRRLASLKAFKLMGELDRVLDKTGGMVPIRISMNWDNTPCRKAYPYTKIKDLD